MPGMFDSIRTALARLSSRQKIQLVLALVATAGVVWGVSAYATRIRYGVLFSRMDPGDAAQVVAQLKEMNVPYRLAAGSTIVEVPVHRVDELRMELAGEGLPRGGGVGFEIFDKPTFGLSDFVQNVNYQRALERELARTIQSLDSVDSARVHLALPSESVFADEKREASASVVVRLEGDVSLPADRVRAITHLVASGVEGLEPDRVSVVDAEGRMLSAGEGSDPTESLSTAQLETKQAMERRIESTLVSILEPIVGVGRARARATVELRTASVQRVEEKYDPDGAVVRSEQKTKSSSGASGPGGVPGTASNLPGGGPSVAGGANGKEQSQSTLTNFEINKTVSTVAEPMGSLIRQSVAVVVDHAVTATRKANGEVEKTTSPRSEEEMAKITDLVRAAAGIDESRGDLLIVENAPFDDTANPADPVDAGGMDWFHLLTQIARYGALPVAVLLVVFLVIRPGIAALRSLRGPTAAGGAPPTIAELQASLAQGALPGGGGSDLRSKLIEAASQDPEAAALVVRGWLDDEGSE